MVVFSSRKFSASVLKNDVLVSFGSDLSTDKKLRTIYNRFSQSFFVLWLISMELTFAFLDIGVNESSLFLSTLVFVKTTLFFVIFDIVTDSATKSVKTLAVMYHIGRWRFAFLAASFAVSGLYSVLK